MAEPSEPGHDAEPDQALIVAGAVIVAGLLFCAAMFLIAG